MKGLLGKIIVVLMAFCLIFGFSACNGGDSNGDKGGGKTETEKPVTIGSYDIDASLEDWSEGDKENHIFIPVQDGQHARIYAKKIDQGVVIAIEAEHFRYITTSQNLFGNSNFRFSFKGGEERYITALRESDGVTAFWMKSELQETGMRSTVFEIFVDKDEIENFSSNLKFGFALRLSGYNEDYFWGFSGLWRIDGCDVNDPTFNLSEAGITKYTATDDRVGIDGVGDDEVWGGIFEKAARYVTNDGFTAKGFLGKDGIYLLLTLEHREANIHKYWCYNVNFEIRVGTLAANKTYRVVQYLKSDTLSSATVGEAVMISDYDEAARMYSTVCEVFIPYENILGVSDENGEAYIGLAARADENQADAWVAMGDSWNLATLKLVKTGWGN